MSEIRENHNEKIYTQQVKGAYNADRYNRATEVVPTSGENRHRRSSKYTGSSAYTPEPEDRSSAQGKGFDLKKLIPIAMIVLGVLLLFAAVYFLFPGLFQPGTSAPAAQVTEFKTTSESHLTGTQILFNLTCTTNVDNVHLADENGQEITATSQRISNDSNRAIWELTAIFEDEYAGLVHPLLFVNQSWIESDMSVRLIVTRPTSAPTEIPAATEGPYMPQDTIPAVIISATDTPAPTDIPTEVPVTEVPTDTPVPIVTQVPADAVLNNSIPTATPEAAPQTEEPAVTEEPTPEPTPIVTPEPTQAPLQVGDVAASPESVGLNETVFIGAKAQDSYRHDPEVFMQDADAYNYYNTGVLTFRGDNFRRNAASGTVEVSQGTLSKKWEFPLGSLRTADSGTLYGVGWNSQPAIVKWPKETRSWMNLYDASKQESAMREVIFSAQDGKVYFINLESGEASRDVINIGFPMRGSVSVDPRMRPLITFGQAISKLPNKTGAIGYYVYNLLDSSRLYFINGRSTDTQKQYSTNGAFDSCSLIIYSGGEDTMVVAGENGLIYSVDLNGSFTYPKQSDPDAGSSVALTVSPDVVYNRSIASGEKEGRTTIESAIAMYANYIYTADGHGIIRCTDINTMKSLWAFDAGDNTDAAVALDLDGDTLSLYTGNTSCLRLKKSDPVSIRRMDALTGKVIWTYEIACTKDSDEYSGCKASPVIGQNDLKDLVFFTVNRVSSGGARLVALKKADGSVAWQFDMNESVSSPVAVYNEAGNGWIIQADSKGNIYVLDGLTGYLNSTTTVDGKIEASPAVYKNLLVIGTCSKEPKMYCFEIQ